MIGYMAWVYLVLPRFVMQKMQRTFEDWLFVVRPTSQGGRRFPAPCIIKIGFHVSVPSKYGSEASYSGSQQSIFVLRFDHPNKLSLTISAGSKHQLLEASDHLRLPRDFCAVFYAKQTAAEQARVPEDDLPKPRPLRICAWILFDCGITAILTYIYMYEQP